MKVGGSTPDQGYCRNRRGPRCTRHRTSKSLMFTCVTSLVAAKWLPRAAREDLTHSPARATAPAPCTSPPPKQATMLRRSDGTRMPYPASAPPACAAIACMGFSREKKHTADPPFRRQGPHPHAHRHSETVIRGGWRLFSKGAAHRRCARQETGVAVGAGKGGRKCMLAFLPAPSELDNSDEVFFSTSFCVVWKHRIPGRVPK